MRIPILDHGYIELVESWGSDERIIEAARMSTNKGFQGWGPRCTACGEDKSAAGSCCPDADPTVDPLMPHIFKDGDEKLLRYLWTHKHATPFEMAGATIEVQGPVFVFREWHRHRTQSYNEMSARYTPLPDLNYTPTVDRCIVVPGSNRQAAGTGARVPTHEEVLDWLDNYLVPSYRIAQRAYDRGLAIGIPKEVARLPVPVARYSRMRASANLRNWLGFLTLRMDHTAQWEIRQYANALHDILAEKFPRTLALFDEER